MSSPPLGFAADIGARAPHGTRVRYVAARCRCADCRRTNTEYQRTRAKAKVYDGWNGLVDASPVRKHLIVLSAAGVGIRCVSDIASVPRVTLNDIKQGRRARIRAMSARRVLAVTAAAAMHDYTLLPCGDLLERLEHLRVFNDWTGRELARRLGYKGNSIQFRDPMTARNVRKVERFLRDWMLRERA